MATKDHLETQLIHAGEPRPRIGGAAQVPIFQSSVFEQAEGADYVDVRYPRLSNLPNHQALARKLAALEMGEDAVVAASGMAAISSTLLAVLGEGGHLLAQQGLYGGTHTLVTRDLPSWGLRFDFIPAADPSAWKAKLRKDTRAIYVEAMTNPLLQVIDHEAVVAFAADHGLVSIIDNTFASPVNFRPLTIGFDLSVHSATKYLNGHSDLAAGAIIGSGDLLAKIRGKMSHLGGALDPHACFLLHRGLKTLALRVRQQNGSALTIATMLAARGDVLGVNYPGLESHPDYRLAKKLFSGYGGMLSFELQGGVAAAKRLIERLRLPIHAPSLGGVETLITRPVTTSHAGVPPEDRARLGIRDGLVRMSIGIEHTDDLIADLEQALAAS